MPPAPRRRDALRAAGSGLLAALAGCAGRVAPRGDPTVTSARTPTEAASPATTATPVPDALTPDDLEFAVEVDRPFTASAPAHLSVRLRNSSDAWLSVGHTPALFYDLRSRPRGLVIIPDDRYYLHPFTETEPGEEFEFVPSTPVDGCWRTSDEYIWDAIPVVTDLAPGDPIREGYTALDSGDGDCLAAGEYTFEQDIHVRKDTLAEIAGGTDDEDEAATVTVGFALRLDERGAVSVEVAPPAVRN